MRLVADLPETTMRALAEAATQGPWTSDGRVNDRRGFAVAFATPSYTDTQFDQANANLALIAHMHPARVVALAAVVEAARGVARARGPEYPTLAEALAALDGVE